MLLSLPWDIWLRLEGFFAIFLLLLGFSSVARRPHAGGRRALAKKLFSYYLITHIVLLLIARGGAWLWGLLVLVGVASCRELLGVLIPQGPRTGPYRVLAYVTPFAALLTQVRPAMAGELHVALLLSALAIPVLWRTPEGSHAHVASTALTVLVAGILPFYVARIRAEHGQAAAFLYLIILLNDGFAEAFGRLFGRTPFFTAISPNKTLEGALGGVAASLVGALLFGSLVPGSRAVWLALIIALSGNLGDLAVSAIKRSVGRKDFDTVLPTHGGVLDRFDSLLYSAPIVYYVLRAVGQTG